MYPENETFIIPVHPPVCEDMKNFNIEEEPMKHELGEISEWAARMALRDYPVGSEQLIGEVTDRALSIQFHLVLSSMVDKGLVDMEWDTEQEDIVYSLTPGGKGLGTQMFG